MTRSYAYPVASFGRFMSDRVRSGAYLDAMRHVITPDSVVLNIGAGTGLFAMLAVKLGARRVFAIETNNIISLATQIAKANGMADRIEFIKGMSTETELDEPADVIVSDLRGVLPHFEQHIASIVDARQRLLAPDGILLPQVDKIWAALVRTPSYYKRRYDRNWLQNDFGLDMTPARSMLTNDWHRTHLRASQLISDPVLAATIDYTSVVDENMSASISWPFDHPELSHGLALWFDTTIYGEHGFSNRPGLPKLIYGQAFFPFDHPIQINVDESITVAISAKVIGGEYIWKWITSLTDATGVTRSVYRQSSIWSQLINVKLLPNAPTASSDD